MPGACPMPLYDITSRGYLVGRMPEKFKALGLAYFD